MKFYEPKILRFLFELTKMKGFMSNRKVSDEISRRGWRLSPRTVDRWMDILKGNYVYIPTDKRIKIRGFDILNYFPTFFYEKLGLVQCYVLFRKADVRRLARSRVGKFCDYAVYLFDTGLKENVLLLSYTIPADAVSKFKGDLEEFCRKGVVRDYELFRIGKSFSFYSAWHRSVDSFGRFNPEKNDFDELDWQMREFEAHLKNLPKPKIHPGVCKNPLIVPSVFEQHRVGKSSVRVWELLKRKLGAKLSDYLPRKAKLSDGAGIKKIQESMKSIDSLGIFHQMRLNYMPFELSNNFYIYFFLEFSSKSELFRVTREIARNSLMTSVRRYGHNKLFFISLVFGGFFESFLKIFSKIKTGRVLFVQHERSLPLLTNQELFSFDYSLCFDAKRCRWKY